MVRIALAQIRAVALFRVQGSPHALIGFQIESQIGFDLVLFQEFEVPVRPAMSPNLKKRIG